MLWRVRTTLADRPGALAGLAHRCGDSHVNILGLQVFPGVDGVTDELVLRAPDGWGLADVARLVEKAGGRRVAVSPCTVHALHDAPTRYLQAAGRLVDEPSELQRILAGVLDAEDGNPAFQAVQDVVDVEVGLVRAQIRRLVPFTDTERARAAAFADLADRVLRRTASTAEQLPSTGHLRPVDGSTPAVRVAQPTDVAAVMRMHERCSVGSIQRRFHTPVPRLGWRMARRLVTPSGGAALLAFAGTEVVGMVTFAPYDGDTFEVGVLVEDAWQRRGIGSMLIHQAARMAKGRGAGHVVFFAHPDGNAVLPTLMRAGLRGRVRVTDAYLEITAGLRDLQAMTSAVENSNAPQEAEDLAPARRGW